MTSDFLRVNNVGVRLHYLYKELTFFFSRRSTFFYVSDMILSLHANLVVRQASSGCPKLPLLGVAVLVDDAAKVLLQHRCHCITGPHAFFSFTLSDALSGASCQ